MSEEADAKFVFEPSVPMHLRSWERRVPARGGDEAEAFRIVSYNVLAESLEDITTNGLDPQIARWENRRLLIQEELRRWDADIVCLQEVDHFDDFFVKFFKQWGYEGKFLKRTGDKYDGCAIFWRCSKFKLNNVHHLKLNVSPTFDRDNIAIIVDLSLVSTPASLLVANTHLLFNPRRGDIKLQQTAMILETLWELSAGQEGGSRKATILCGDFNSSPFSPLYDFIASGSLLLDKKQCPSLLSGQVTWDHWRKMHCLPVIPSLRRRSGGTIRPCDLVPTIQFNHPHPRDVCRFFAEGTCRHPDCRFLHVRSPMRHMPQPRSRTTNVWPDWWRELQTFLKYPHINTERQDLAVKSPDTKKRFLQQEGAEQRQDAWVMPGAAQGEGRTDPPTREADDKLGGDKKRGPPLRSSRGDAEFLLKHPFKFSSVYSCPAVRGSPSEPACTTFHGGSKLTVDYIWVTPEIEVVGVWEMIPLPVLDSPHTIIDERKFYGLPSHHWGSDHMALACVVRLSSSN